MATGFPSIEKETRDYLLLYRFNESKGRAELVMRRKGAGKHFACHTRYNLLDQDGRLKETRPITEEVARFIMAHFDARGDTASFEIHEDDIASGKLAPARAGVPEPAQIRHARTDAEQSYTSTGAKLNHHWPIFAKFRDTGFGSIIRATMTLHQVCSSHCHYCSTIARNRKDSISLAEAKAFVEKLYHDQAAFNREQFGDYNDKYRAVAGTDIRLRGLILSGGGQPNLWPHFEEFVAWLATLDIDLGLITNGFPATVDDAIYRKFKWIRLSVTPEDASPHYPQGRFDLQRLPATIVHNPDVLVGLSYVYGPWTDDDILRRIDAAIGKYGFDYCRLLTDCNLARGAQLRAHQALADKLHALGFIDEHGNPLSRLFHQLKYHGTHAEADALWEDGQCFLQLYNVFWDTTGHEERGHSYCYACDSITVLAEEAAAGAVSASERRFNHEKWGTVRNDRVEDLYRLKVRPFFDPRETCSACLFMRNNQAVKDLVRTAGDGTALPAGIDHVNFP